MKDETNRQGGMLAALWCAVPDSDGAPVDPAAQTAYRMNLREGDTISI